MKQLSRSAQKRDNNRRIFASLRLVNGDRIGKLQFFQQFKRILYFSLFIVFNFQCFSICIDLGDNSHIAIKNPHPFIHRQSILGCDLPFKLIVILDLHHLVAHAEFVIAIFFFRFSRLRWIQILLQNTVQPFHSQQSFPHRCEYLDIIWFCIDIFGKLLLDQCQQNTDDHIRILSFQEEEIPAFIIQKNRFSPVDLMCIYHNITLLCLSENPGQHDNRKTFRCDEILQNTSRAY